MVTVTGTFCELPKVFVDLRKGFIAVLGRSMHSDTPPVVSYRPDPDFDMFQSKHILLNVYPLLHNRAVCILYVLGTRAYSCVFSDWRRFFS